MDTDFAAAKLRPPGTAGALRRDRLFERLDALRSSGAAVWIEGAAGAGKSTLAATYAAQSAAALAWYRIDGVDADAAGFFHYLERALRPHLAAGTELPALGSESLAGLAAFARTFFAELAAALRPGVHLVFDNAEALAADSPVQWLLAMLIEQPAIRCGVFFAGRIGPWNALAPLCADGRLVRLPGESLYFDGAELRRLLGVGSRPPAEEDLRSVMAATGGWPVAVELLRGGAIVRPGQRTAPDEELFDDLAREVLAGLAPRSRDLLAALSVAETLTPALMFELSGDPDAARIVERLAAGPFPISVAADGGSRQFRLHALLRAHLLRVVQRGGDADRLRVLAARVHEREHRFEEAAQLLAQARDWPGLAALAARCASALLMQGRNRELLAWLDALPPEHRLTTGWTPFWRAQALLALDPADARRAFEAAHACFAAEHDAAGCLLASAGALAAVYFGWDDFAPALPWIDELARLLPDPQALTDPLLAAQVLAAAHCIHYAAPDHPLLPALAARGEQLLPLLPPRAQAPVAVFLLEYHLYSGHLARVEAVLTALRAGRPGVPATPLLRAGMHIFAAVHAFLVADHETCQREAAAGIEIVERYGVTVVARIVLGQQVYGAISAGDLDLADRGLEAFRAGLDAARRIDVALLHHLRSGVRLLRGEIDAARQDAEFALEVCDACSARAPALLCRLALAQVCVRGGDFGRALELLDAVDALCERRGAELIAFIAKLARCGALLGIGQRAQALGTLAAALTAGCRNDYVNAHPFWQPEVMARLLNLALENDIEPHYARRLIRLRALAAPIGAGPAWPWPVRVRSLGTFQIEADGAEAGLDARRQQKPLLLLQALLAIGADGASKADLADAVWPDAEGDAAQHTLEVNLQRLRARLCYPAALLLEAGAVRLNRALCWVDLWEMDAVVRRADDADLAAHAPALARRLLGAYRGPFLPGVDAAWADAARSMLAARFARVAGKLAAELESSGQSELAVECCQRALEAEPLAEELVCRLMQLLAARGQHAEALSAYQRFVQLLRDRLGLRSSGPARRLAERLQAARAGVAGRSVS